MIASWTDASASYGAEQLGWNNKPVDGVTGWSDHGARWMATEMGRWMTPDPPVRAPDSDFLFAPWDAHPYQYVRQNPLVYWDPDGNACVTTQRGEGTLTVCSNASEFKMKREAEGLIEAGPIGLLAVENSGEKTVDAVAGYTVGITGLPVDEAPFGNNEYFGAGMVAGGGTGLALDGAAIATGSGMQSGSASCMVATNGACAPVAAVTAATGWLLVAAGAAMTPRHLDSIDRGFVMMSNSSGSGGGNRLTPRAARRKATREAGIPTSQQPKSQRSVKAPGNKKAGRQYDYEVQTPGGGTQEMSVQHSLTDRVKGHGPHWEAGKVKPGGQRDSLGRPRLRSDKVKVDE